MKIHLLVKFTVQTGLCCLTFCAATSSVSAHSYVNKLVPVTARSVDQIVTGLVKDDKNSPLPGVSIVIKGTTSGTTTDANGQFRISVVNSRAVLVFSFVGYKSQEITVGSQEELAVTLLTNDQTLNEVVVVGYGSQLKKELTGSVQTVAAKDLTDQPVPQLTQKLQGRLAGVQINQTTGKPGQGMSVRIRGQASILAGSDPLYVVDGQPLVGDISNINPDEVENVTVLKDAASTSLYGSRAANGVVLITTRQAKKGQSSLTFSAFTGWQTVPQKGRPQVMNAQEFAQFKKESYEDLGQAVPSVFQNPAQYANQNNDWYGGMLQTAPIHSYNLSATASKDKFSTALVAGYFSQDGVLKNSNLKRFSLRINSDYAVSSKVSLGANLAPSYTINNTPSTDGAFYATNVNAAVPGGLLFNALLTWPTLPYQNPDGSLPLTAWIPGLSAFPTPNWYRALNEITNETRTSRLLSNAYIVVRPVEGLTLKSTINVDLGQINFSNFNPSTASTSFASLPPSVATSVRQNTQFYSWANENTATYNRSFGGHNLEALAGYTAQKYSSRLNQLSLSNFPDDRINTLQSAINVVRTSSLDDIQEWGLVSYLARLNYNYKGRYLLTAAIRRDGSSRFGVNNRWGNFPSIGLGWLISDESFLKSVQGTISFAKLRASYGIIGNNSIGNYTQYALINNTLSTILGTTIGSGAAVSSLGNPNLGWETTKQLDLGLDLGLFNDRIQFTYDFYTKNTTNLLYNVAVPQESGFTNFNDNIGELKFWGHEFSVTSRNTTGKLQWTTTANLSFNRNRVLALAPGVERIYGGGGNYQTITQVGQPIGQFYGMIQEGVYKNAEEFNRLPKAAQSQVGTVKYRDVNGDGVITFGGDRDDRTVIGNPFPTSILGLVNTFKYGPLDLSIVGSGSFGNSVAVMTDQGTTNLDGVFNVLKGVQNRWRSEQNPGDGLFGKTTAATFMERDWFSTRFISNASFFTIKNVTLGYTLPTSLKFFKSARVYGSVQQALVFTNYRGANPEVSNTAGGTQGTTLSLGFDYGAYPVPRTVTLGLNLSF